jgi:hypothetical protein
MSKKIIIAALLFGVNFAYAQVDEYAILIKKADSLYKAHDYKNSADTYSSAFRYLGWKGFVNNRYNAACIWAMANVPDSAFYNLEKITRLLNFKNYDHIIKDSDLVNLHSDSRWEPLINLIKKNRDSADIKVNIPLMNELIKIYNDDQSFRIQAQELQNKYGNNSDEFKKLWKTVQIKDSINLDKITEVLDKYGWLGRDIVGDIGNSALFLVIQHADLKTQEKYLSMMQDAVKAHRANRTDLALLEDRIEIRNGRKQIYGSQIGMSDDNKYYISPLLDPEKVDERRAKVGLPPLSEYVKYWDINWDVELYKKDLPHLVEIQKKY